MNIPARMNLSGWRSDGRETVLPLNMFLLTKDILFPPVNLANEDGLLAIGGDLSTERLLLAYRSGIFPWYNEGEPICWWSHDPRFVLFPHELKISKSMHRILKQDEFQFSINKDFAAVIQSCKTITRKDQPGTWISPAVQEAYCRLHTLGHAHSAEAWMGESLVGGLYGIRIGNVFFGESMFSTVPNASKFALINYVQHLQKDKVQLIDCQVYTRHLESFGARMIPRANFITLLDEAVGNKG